MKALIEIPDVIVETEDELNIQLRKFQDEWCCVYISNNGVFQELFECSTQKGEQQC